MALDPSVYFQGGGAAAGVPNVMAALQSGIQANQAIRQAPLMQKLLEQRAQSGQQAIDQQSVSSGQQVAQFDQAQKAKAGSFIHQLTSQMKGQTPEQRVATVAQNAEFIQSLGQDPSKVDVSDEGINRLNQATSVFANQNQNQGSVRVQEFEKWKAMPEGDEKKALGRIIGAVSRSESVEDYVARKQAEADVRLNTAGDIKAAEKEGSSRETREQGFIDSGIDAAESMVTVSRAISLLDDLETGGFNNTALKAKQLFGIESANEAELSNALGVAVLAQLKPIFGAAFTVQEGDRLERLSAGFGKSTEGNRRILNQQLKMSDRAARRALKLAKSKGDQFTVEEIESTLEAIKDIKSGAAGNALDPNASSAQDDTALFSKYGIE